MAQLEPSVTTNINACLLAYSAYKSQKKQFQAIRVLLQGLKSIPGQQVPKTQDQFTEKLQKLVQCTENYRKLKITVKRETFIIFATLGDIFLKEQREMESLNYFMVSYQAYSQSSINQKIFANTVLSGVISIAISQYRMLISNKDQNQAIKKKQQIQDLIQYTLNRPEYALAEDKLKITIGSYYFLLFSQYNNPDFFQEAENYLQQVQNPQIRIVMDYFTDPEAAKQSLVALISQHSTSSILWTYLGIMESTFARRFNALKRALVLNRANWVAWTTLGLIQAQENDYVNSAKTWKLAHSIHQKDSKLWLLSSFLYSVGNKEERVLDNLLMACELNPAFYLMIKGNDVAYQ